MNSNNLISFFEDLILENQLAFHRKNFFNEAQEETPNVEIDKDNDLVYFYDVNGQGETKRVSITFRKYYRSLLKREFKEVLYKIENLKQQCTDNEFSDLRNRIVSKIDYIEQSGNNVEYFDLSFAPLSELRNRITNGYFGNKDETDENSSISDYYLRVKHEFTKSFFDSLYEIASEYYLINVYNLTEEEFFDVLTSPVSKNKIKFEVDNEVSVSFFEAIKDIFVKFNAKEIEKTERFITNRGTPISQTNYNKNKNVSSKHKDLIDRLTNDIQQLIASYT
ncbi:hypothetical protein [Seonamhaeicola maritimus]|uniref:hypothetical protein n=1 Tax=Seonamhaeicola maritimus TaxID=2591822 RepID=UPI002495348C|nr:hypothetical protein [Seonamhaeicola maritimus]